MSTVIKSGLTGNTVEVDGENRMRTFAITQDASVDASAAGDAFFITSGIVNLTSASQSFIFYCRNSDSVSWIVEEFFTIYGPSTGASGLSLSDQFVVNPTGGTVITSGTPTAAVNVNSGSPKVLPGVFLIGAEGSTATGGGAVPPGLIVKDQAVVPFRASPITLAPGTSFAFSVTPGVGNTSMDVQFDFAVYRKTENR